MRLLGFGAEGKGKFGFRVSGAEKINLGFEMSETIFVFSQVVLRRELDEEELKQINRSNN